MFGFGKSKDTRTGTQRLASALRCFTTVKDEINTAVALMEQEIETRDVMIEEHCDAIDDLQESQTFTQEAIEKALITQGKIAEILGE